MYAHHADPFSRYSADPTAASKYQRPDTLQDREAHHGPMPAPNTQQSKKRTLYFEPEFVEALDASLQEPPVTLSRPRPSKRVKRSFLPSLQTAFSQDISAQPPLPPPSRAETIADEPFPSRDTGSNARASPSQSLDGPSIVDLSSGEKLQPLHLGESDHKRRRDSIADASSASEPLREVFDVQSDGSLLPTMDHAPATPSPTKRLRRDPPMFWNSRVPTPAPTPTPEGRPQRHLSKTIDPKTRNSSTMLDGHMGLGYHSEERLLSLLNTMGQKDDMNENEENQSVNSSRLESRALIRYEGPRALTLADGVDALLMNRWTHRSLEPTTSEYEPQGHEMVLYRPPAGTPAALFRTPTRGSGSLEIMTRDHDDDDDGEVPMNVRIEELDDDDQEDFGFHNLATVNTPIQELEDKIMGMDLD
ncbi:hypothetical protein BGW38_003278 [Lunasporangiospora selenospora]|uniref:Uncharacterized protein n=1 Tax=Lunasporangiospora selenospora TaxID=979761 RepID=A0A9P6FRN1_9FUNG|nr:hypothetical protein BGW38_003278 [Lunasporangiospora selenospora]